MTSLLIWKIIWCFFLWTMYVFLYINIDQVLVVSVRYIFSLFLSDIQNLFANVRWGFSSFWDFILLYWRRSPSYRWLCSYVYGTRRRRRPHPIHSSASDFLGYYFLGQYHGASRLCGYISFACLWSLTHVPRRRRRHHSEFLIAFVDYLCALPVSYKWSSSSTKPEAILRRRRRRAYFTDWSLFYHYSLFTICNVLMGSYPIHLLWIFRTFISWWWNQLLRQSDFTIGRITLHADTNAPFAIMHWFRSHISAVGFWIAVDGKSYY